MRPEGRHPQQHARRRLAAARRSSRRRSGVSAICCARAWSADGLYFVGVDLVGDKILEINVFAPGGIANINELYGIDVGTAVIRDLERKVELRARLPRAASRRTCSCARSAPVAERAAQTCR